MRERGRRGKKSDSLIRELEEKQSKYLIEIGREVKLVEPFLLFKRHFFFVEAFLRKKNYTKLSFQSYFNFITYFNIVSY